VLRLANALCRFVGLAEAAQVWAGFSLAARSAL